MKVLVIGGGAAGLTASITAAARGAEVTLLEKNDRVGRKILATGNGRCNLMNTGAPAYAHGKDLAETQLSRWGTDGIRAFFDACGLLIAAEPEEDGRLYPACGQAAAVLDALRARAADLKVQVRTDESCTRIEKTKRGFTAHTPGNAYPADRVILCCGSPAGGGSDSYSLATALGHSLVPLVPALCPLECDMRAFRAFKGLRVPAVLSLYAGERFVSRAGGECLFAESGLSGIPAMQLAADAAEAMRNRRCLVRMDLSPLLNLAPRKHFYTRTVPENHEDAALRFLESRSHLPSGPLRGALPRPMAEYAERTAPTPNDTARLLTSWPFAVTGTRAKNAQVIRGGISAREVDPVTMQSRLVPGLFLCGEMLDVDGDCGGFNLMFAWASALSAGEAAARGKE